MGEQELSHEGLRPVDTSPKATSPTDVTDLGERPSSSIDVPAPRASDEVARTADGQTRQLGYVLDRTSQPFAAVDFDGRITYANRAFEELIGYPLAELRGLSVRDFTPPQWRRTTREMLARISETGTALRYEKEYVRKDGRCIPIEAIVDLDKGENDVPRGFYAFVTDITERKQVERALRESEERFRLLYDEAPVGYHEIDTEGRLVSINRTECEMLGYRREDVLGRSVFEFVAEESREEARRAFPEKIRGERPLRTFERTVIHADGRRLTLSIEERYRRDEHGRIIGLRSAVQDITERKQTEAALVASERRARILFEGIEDAVFVHAPDGRILDANPAASRLLGYSHEELLRMSTRDIDDPEFASGFEARLQSQMSQGHLSCEGRHRRKDGVVIPVDINTSTILFDGERAVLAVIRDISERHALEETRRQFAEAQMRNARDIEAKNLALTASEARYRQLTLSSIDAVVVADCQGLITLFNPAAEKTFGYAADEVIGQLLTVLIPPEFRTEHDFGFQRYVRTREAQLVGKTVELRGRRKNGEIFPLELSLSAVESGGELQFLGSIRDQTERQRMRAMLAQSEKLASIGLLSAGVAHEINNPLAYVANNLAVLERDTKSILELMALYESARPALAGTDPELVLRADELTEELDWEYVRDNLPKMLCRTREGVQRVAAIVQNLRGLARTSPPKMESASIPDLLESALEMIRGRLRRHEIAIEIDYGDAPRIVCVASQISQVFLNLLINAAQAIESAGRTDGGKIRFVARRAGNRVVLSFYDNGCGIAHDVLPKLFDPFFTTKSVGEGTGLGLSISHGIVTGHGGEIEVDSPPGGETCFRVFLPINAN